MADSIFRKESLKKVSSPEELNDYIKVTSPGVWLAIAAAAALLIAALVWAIFGSLESSVTVQGLAKDGKVQCFVTDTSAIHEGCSVQVGGKEGKVTSVSTRPISREQAIETSGGDEYDVYCLDLSDWNYVVEITAADVSDGLVTASVVTDSVSPLSFLFG